MSRKIYDTAVFGATFLGIGAALSLKNAVIIEKGGVFGADFVNSYKCGKRCTELPKTELGKLFFEQLQVRNLINQTGEIYPAPTVYVLSKFLKENPIDILLMTEVTEICKQDECFRITVYHASGFETIYAKNLIDTTATGIGHEKAKEKHIEKSLNSIIYNPEGNRMDRLMFNAANGLYTYALPVKLETDRCDAVEEMYEAREVFLSNHMQVSSIASDFSYTMQPCHEFITEGFLWNPSAAYSNLVEAFDMGVQVAGGVYNDFT